MGDIEEWRDVEGWSFNQVSNYGRVRVLPGGVLRWPRIAVEIEIRKLTPNKKNGYVYVGKRLIHHLVLNAFVGPCPSGQECRHLNGNRSDNRWPKNIKWGTREENYEDRIRHGTDNRGERHPLSKLTQSDVESIRIRQGPRGLVMKLAKEFNVSYRTISAIRNGLLWRDSEAA